VYPQQVLLEVLVGEVTLDDTLKLGIDWTFNNTFGSGGEFQGTGTLDQGNPVNNFTYLVTKTGRLTAAFRSLATNGKASVLSSPSIIATNGKKARINVADQVPVVTSTLLSNTNPPVTTTTVEYRDVGVLLSFTPYINDSGLVTLEIEQEVSEVSATSSSANTNPTFFKRSISTNLVASQDQSIVLGGLVKERKSLGRAGLPWFYKIPVFGWLFGSRDDTVSRTELLIFITPRVIRNVEEGIRLSHDFEDRVQQLKSRMGETQGLRLRKDAGPK
jgi:general secretion pathway protein D